MIVNGETLRAMSKGFRALFYDVLFAAPENRLLDLFYPVQSSNMEETFSIVKGIPKMREWVGERIVRSISATKMKIAKKDYEATLGVDVDDLKYDRFNQVRTQISQLGRSFLRHYGDFAIDYMKNAFGWNAYDNQYVFDTDHKSGRALANYPNKSTNEFSAAEWQLALDRAATLADTDSDESLEVMWTHIFFGALAFSKVQGVFNVRTVNGGDDNIYYNNIPEGNRVLVRGLGASKKWFLFDLSSPDVKPLILLTINGVNFTAIDRPTDETVFNYKTLVYGIDCTDNAAPMYWERAYGSTAGE